MTCVQHTPQHSHLVIEKACAHQRAAIYQQLSPIASLYPNFEAWFNFTFWRALKAERSCLISYKNKKIAGVSLLKQTATKSKICTFFVAPEWRGQGIRTALMQASLEHLKHAPIITVSEERYAELLPLLRQFNFNEIDRCPKKYRSHSSEIIFQQQFKP